MSSGLLVFAATLAAGGVTLWGAMCEGWIGWLPRRRKPAHKAPSLARDVVTEAAEVFAGFWYGLRDLAPVVLYAVWVGAMLVIILGG